MAIVNKSKYENIYELSPVQSGLLFHALYQPESDAYFVQHIFELTNLNTLCWHKAWHTVVSRHDSLRASFVWERLSKPLQRIQTEISLPWIEEDWDKEVNHEKKLQAWIESERKKRFDLSKAPLMRFNLIKINNNSYYFIWNLHHLLVDGWSIPIIVEEVITAYYSFINNEPVKLKARRPYKDYISWLLSQDQSIANEYWKESLLGAIPSQLNDKLITDTDEYGETLIMLNEEETHQLNHYAKSLEVTANTLIQGVWSIFLSKYIKQDDLVLGVTVSGRNIELSEVEDMVGIFINTLPIRIKLKPTETIKELLKRLQIQMIEAQSYGYIPLSTIQSLSKERNLFDCIYVFENYPISNNMISGDNQNDNNRLLIKPSHIIEKTEYKLSLAVIPKIETEIRLNYKKRFFSQQEAQKIMKYLRQLISNIVQNEHQYVGNISLLNKIEVAELCKESTTPGKYPENQCIHYLFEEVAKDNKNRAIIYEDKHLSYLELNERSNQLAHYLRKQGVRPGSLVAIACYRSLEMIIAIFGILKAGGAYVPIDPDYPKERIQFMLEDTKATLLLVQQTALEKLPIIKVQMILLDKLSDELTNYPKTNPAHMTELNHLAYIIYTSGSTGNPRGVMISHRNISNSIKSQGEIFEIHRHKHMLQFASYTFDASAFEIFLALTSGISLFLFNKEKIFHSSAFVQLSNQNMIDFMALPPSFLLTLSDDQFPHLKTLIIGGETPSSSVVQRWRKNRQLINAYGPTECAICSSTFSYQKGSDPSVIGKPIANTQIYIFDASLNPVPKGIPGELYIGGEGVARGYLNRPSLTAERFLPNPFAENAKVEGSRLYRTGDLARYLEDGNIEFLGRIDHQIKLRGFRIELGEIESTIQGIEEITQSVALIREDSENQKRLVVYLVLERLAERTTENQNKERKTQIINKCREVCKSKLPDYMQPNHIIVLEKLPLTLNGKIDKQVLPKPEGREEIENYEDPVGELEQQLAEIWKEILKVEKIGRNDNFFSLGGDSIVSIQMVSRARTRGIIFDVKQVFEARTIAGLIMNAKKASEVVQINQDRVLGTAPLLPIQQWFLEMSDNSHHFNQACWIVPKETGIVADTHLNANIINLNKLKECLEKIVNHHEAFRLKFKKANDGWEQYYSEDCHIPFEIIAKSNWSDDKLEEICSNIQSSLNIEKGPLSKLLWFEGKGLFWVIHHLIIDGVSWRILLEDLNTLYEGKSLALKSHSYQAWGEYLHGYDKLETTCEYYKGLSETTLPLEETSDRINYSISFSEKITKDFIQKAQKAYNTQANDLLLTALVQAIGEYTHYQLWLDLEGHGREVLSSDLDLTRTIGWFTSIFPVYLMLSDPSDLDKSIKEIKEQLRKVPKKGITYGIASFIMNQLPRMSTKVAFNYLGQWDSIDVDGNTFKLGNDQLGQCSNANDKLLHSLDIYGQVKDGILSFVWSSNYQEPIIKKIANNFKKKLESLVIHCSKEGICGYTSSDFELVRLSQYKLDTTFHGLMENIYPLSPLQGGLLFQTLYQPESDSYFIQSVFELDNINVSIWQKAWHSVINRYDSLRACFIWEGLDEPVQVIRKEVELSWNEEDWIVPIDKNNKSIEERLQKLLHFERKQGFELNKAPLMRFNLIQIAKSKYYFIWNMHHLLTDGWSGSIILTEVLESYNLKNQQINLKERRPYKDYMSWLSRQDQAKAKRYWEQCLLGVTPTRIEGNTEIEEDGKDGEQCLVLNTEETDKLNNFAKSIGVTSNALLQGIWALYLSKYTRQEDVVFGVVVSGRNIELPGIEEMVGTFINTLPLRVQFKPNETVKELIQRLQTQMSEVQESGYIPLSTIQSLQNEGNLFDNIFVYQNYPISYESCDNHHDILSIKFINVIEKTEYKLAVTILPEKELKIKLNYDGRFFKKDTISNLSKNLHQLILNVMQNQNQFIGNISLIDKNQLAKLDKLNDSEKTYSLNKCVHELFEEIVMANKDRTAVVYKDLQLTYEVLNQKANQLGHYLKKNQVGPETLVGICVPRNLNLIIGFLGILKSGGVYVPLDPEYPKDRLEYMLEDAGIKILLTTADLEKKFEGYKGKIICFDNKEYSQESIVNLDTKILPDNLAYVIYTSGSTGKAKGVTVKHHSLINNIEWHSNKLKIINARILQRASSSFDASVWEIAMPLLKAHTLIILPDNNEVQSDGLNDFITEYECNVIQLTPSLIEIFRAKGNKLIEHIVVGGEALTLGQVAIIKQNLPETLLHNVYGATESCIDASHWLVDKNKELISVGKPIDNMQLHVLDEYLNPVPIGMTGEIYIGGEGLARGYLNRPSLTAEKFIPNPFIKNKDEDKKIVRECQMKGKTRKEGSRLYKTGDMGRYSKDGNLEFLGRIDYQVKVRGFRIELGEIEFTLQSIDEVKQCVVTIREDIKNQKSLVAYIILDNSIKSSNETDQTIKIINQCREVCKTKLPEYMQLSQIMILESLPLTPNGKVDRKALPRPDARDGGDNYELPSTEQEQLICDAFAKVLMIDKIGAHDDFFMLGGNSILAIHLVVILQVNFDIKVKDIFEFRTPKRLAANSGFDKNVLIKNLERIKLLSKNKLNETITINSWAENKIDQYLKNTNQWQKECSSKKPIINVLLTGATGFLGCNILNQLLHLTDYRLFLLIRANSQQEAMTRISKKFQFYFNKSLDSIGSSRIIVLNADIEKEKLGLTAVDYETLVTQIDSVIHAAALVKHYGEYNHFYSANVQATINLLDMVKLTKLKDFHFVSTCSVLSSGFISNREGYVYTEDDLPNNLELTDNVYVQTKLLGEREVVKYRDYKVTSNIYRVGNLAFMSENSRVQENIQDNAFLSWLKCLLNIKCVTNNIHKMEISTTDDTAQAIVRLFDKKHLGNGIYHVVNPHLFNISEAFNKNKTLEISSLTSDQFIDNIIKQLESNINRDLIVKFLLHQGWLDDREFKNSYPSKIHQDKTDLILKRLNFDWVPITQQAFDKCLNNLISFG